MIESGATTIDLYDAAAPAYSSMFESFELLIQTTGVTINRAFSEIIGGQSVTVIAPMCGPGTEIFAAANCGHRGLGTDKSKAMLKVAAQEACKRRLESRVEFRVADAEHLPPELKRNRYSAALVLGNSLAAFLEPAQLTRVFSQIRAALPLGAPFLLSTRSYGEVRSQLERGIPIIDSCEFSDGRMVRQRWQGIQSLPGTYILDLEISSGRGPLFSGSAICRAWTQAEVDAALRDAQFGQLEWHDNRSDESVYRSGLDQLICVAIAE